MLRIICTAAVAFAFLGFVPVADAGAGKKKGFDAEAVFKKLDTANTGKITKEQFLKLIDLRKKAPKNPEKAAKKLDKLFDKLDTNKDGVLTFEEFKKITELKHKKKDKKAKNPE